MAKCVKHNDEIKRVSDDEAERIVRAGGKYVPKKDWRASRR